ncbi:MAG: MarR family transcriptional regulator [Tindallia sp. MSAO_Bac2]|nr:MAG: MarR family transcriptional regulator [Tindallia sp. MSAO_Bac2]
MIMTAVPYLKENIDEQLTVKPWDKKNHFPLFLRNSYRFYDMKILETQCVLMEVLHQTPNIDQLQKHIKQIKNIADRQVVLFYKDISRYRRRSLIEKRIAFVIEDGQMYLPFLGLDLKKAQEQAQQEVKRFTTPAQIAYLYFLYHKDEVVNMTRFAEKMGFNYMTASRALNELYHANLITYEVGGKTGRSKEYKRIPDPDYFLNGRKYLKTPVRKTIYTRTKPLGALNAGLDALAGLSMINTPDHPVMAIDRKQLNEEKFEIVRNKDLIKDSKLVELQLWDYDPKLFAENQHVDLLSLYASLREDTDERVEQALEEALRGELWYTD